MTIVGGLRERYILESFKNFVYDALADLGWFDSGRDHALVKFRTEPIPNSEEIVPNVVSIIEEHMAEFEDEMGSNLTEFRREYAIDIYAENDAVGRHLWGDIRSILQGRFTSVTDGLPHFPVYDPQQATPPVIFYCQLENVVGARQKDWQKAFEKYWWTILVDVVDHYGNEDDDD